jgi:hypothetical protein
MGSPTLKTFSLFIGDYAARHEDSFFSKPEIRVYPLQDRRPGDGCELKG